MKKIKIIWLPVLLTVVFFISCSEGIGDSMDKEGSNYTSSPVIIGWDKSSVSENYFSDIGTLINQYPINILGGGDGYPTTGDIVINLSVDTENSTAEDGKEFSFPYSSVTIPAGSSYALVPININTGAFNPSGPTNVVINASTSTDGVVVSAFAQTMTITFVGCKSDLASYSYMVTTEEEGYSYGPYLETLTEESVNSFLTYSVGTWDPPLNPGHGIRFEDICGTLKIPKQQLADLYSIEVGPLGTTTVDENGNFVLNYYIDFWGEIVPIKSTYIRQ